MRRATLATAIVILAATAASAQTSPTTASPDGQLTMVQKNVGFDRWAIVQDRTTRAVSGNVFDINGGFQFVWCQHLGGTSYQCVQNAGCTQEPCQWLSAGTVSIPDSFFQVGSGPAPTPAPTPPAGGLQGLLGTWDFTYEIISSFTDTIRLQRVEPRDGRNLIFGLGQGDTPVVGGFANDIIDSSSLPFRFAAINFGSIICTAYVFDQSGNAAAGIVAIADRAGTGCGQFRGGYVTVGIRFSRTAEARGTAAAIRRSARRAERARQLDAKDSMVTSDPKLLEAIGDFAAAVAP